MKTISFKGTENQLKNLGLALHISDNSLPREVEILVYVMSILLKYDQGELEDATDEEFKALAEEEGRVYTLEDFQEAFALNEVTPNVDIIRFISVIV